MREAISEKEMKQAFRLAYEMLSRHNGVENTTEYFDGVIRDGIQTWKDSGRNPLLSHLIIAVFEFLYTSTKGMNTDDSNRVTEGS